jgi:hypothetical protein
MPKRAPTEWAVLWPSPVAMITRMPAAVGVADRIDELSGHRHRRFRLEQSGGTHAGSPCPARQR